MKTKNPCPFCGEKKKLKIFSDWTYYYVVCEKCGANGPTYNCQNVTKVNVDDKAFSVWNKRFKEKNNA